MSNHNRNLRVSPEELHLTGKCSLLEQEDLPLFVSVFTVALVDVNGEKHVLMVRNAEERRADGTTKPAGWGLPGGGVRSDETPSEAAVREVFFESGLHVVNPTWERYEHNVLVPLPGGFRYTRCHLALRAIAEDEFVLESGMRQTLVHIFTAEFLWEGPVADILNEMLEKDPGAPLILEISPALGENLGIREASEEPEKPQEINAVGLFPLSDLIDFEVPPEGFYRSHLARMRRALEKYLPVMA